MFWITSVAMALDQLVNAICGGYPDETISLHAARARNEGKRWGCILCKVLDSIVSNHCDHAIVREHESITRRKL